MNEAFLELITGDPAKAFRIIERNLEIAETEENALFMFKALLCKAFYKLWTGDANQALAISEEAKTHLNLFNTPGRELKLALTRLVALSASDSVTNADNKAAFYYNYCKQRLHRDLTRKLIFKAAEAVGEKVKLPGRGMPKLTIREKIQGSFHAVIRSSRIVNRCKSVLRSLKRRIYTDFARG